MATTSSNGATVDNLNVLDANGLQLINVASVLFSSTNATQTVTIDSAFWTDNLTLTFAGTTAQTYFTITGFTASSGNHYFVVSQSDQNGFITGNSSGPIYVTSSTTASAFVTAATNAAATIGGGSTLLSSSVLAVIDASSAVGKEVFQATLNGQIENIFSYSSATDSFNGTGSQWDVINNFNEGTDKLDFTRLVNDPYAATVGGKTAFSIGLAEFIWIGPKPANTTSLGPAGAYGVWYTSDGSGGSFVYADTTGDGTADLKIDLPGVATLQPTDFLGVDPPTSFAVTINPIEPSQANQWLINAGDANAPSGLTVTGTTNHLAPGAILTVTIGSHSYTATVLSNGNWSAPISSSDLRSLADEIGRASCRERV